MKATKKVFMALLALLAIFALASCKDDDDDDDVTVVARFYGTGDGMTFLDDDEKEGVTSCVLQMTVTFYSDKSYNIKYNISATGTGGIATQDWTDEVGTYTGDPKLNGKVSLTTRYEYDETTNRLKAVNPSTEEFTIENGKVTITDSDSGFSITLTRQ